MLRHVVIEEVKAHISALPRRSWRINLRCELSSVPRTRASEGQTRQQRYDKPHFIQLDAQLPCFIPLPLRPTESVTRTTYSSAIRARLAKCSCFLFAHHIPFGALLRYDGSAVGLRREDGISSHRYTLLDRRSSLKLVTTTADIWCASDERRSVRVHPDH